MVATSAVRNLRDGSLKILDGTPVTPLNLALEIDQGNLKYVIHSPHVTVKNRGVLDHSRAGDQQEVDVSFGILVQQYQYHDGASTGISVPDTLYKQGGASAWLSTGQSFEDYCVDLQFSILNPGDAAKKETLTFSKFRVDTCTFSEAADGDTFEISGKAFITKPGRAYA